MNKKLLVVLLAMGAITGAVFAQSDVEVTAEADLYSAYVWRGQIRNHYPVLQPSLNVAKGPLSFEVWANYMIEGKRGNNNTDWTEYRFTFAYQLPEDLIMEDLDVQVGVTKYTYAGAWSAVPNTEEIFVKAIFNNIILSPVLDVYYDINEASGWYGSFGLGHTMEVSDALNTEVGASIGYGTRNYNRAYFGNSNGSGAMNDYNVYASASYALNEDLALGALLQYTYLDGGVSKRNPSRLPSGAGDNLLWGGVTLSYKF